MGKTAFIFPGQGAQYIGMGKGFFEKEKKAEEVFLLAEKITGLPVAKLCMEENDKLNITEYTQVAMLTVELALWNVLRERGIQADYTAGLSLGEYGAITACGMMRMEDALAVVRKRGIYMQEEYPVGGAMSAVLGMDNEKILEICEQTEGEVSIANYNCPGQIVITGEANAVEKAGDTLKENGAKRVVPLKVSGPFHSKLMEGAGNKLAVELAKIDLSYTTIPYLANVTGMPVYSPDGVKALLTKQVFASVRWQQSMEWMYENGVDTFVEIGPGKTLAGFARKICKDARVINIDKYEDFEKNLEELYEITG